MKLHIKSGRVIDPASRHDAVADVFVADGKIAGIGNTPAGFAADRVIEAGGHVVMPGLVDLSARLREPGFEYKATLASEMAAAMAGGVTSLVCPPDTDPVLDEVGLVDMLRFRAQKLNRARVFPLGALTVGLKGAVLTEMAALADAGCIGFTHAEVPILDTNVLLRAMQYANTFGYTVWLRPQDAWLGKGGVAASGPVASRLGLAGVPVAAETVALHVIFELVRLTGARVHLCRISSADGVELVARAKRQGLPVTCDVAIHHLHLTDVDIGYFNPQMRMTPPLRSVRDRDALVAGVVSGVIDAICSDHTPVDDDEKLLPFAEASPGSTGLELLLPLTLQWAHAQNLPLVDALRRVTAAPAGIIRKPVGELAVGAAADLAIFDPEAVWVVRPSALKSQGKNSPFTGFEMQGRVVTTLVDGRIACDQPHPDAQAA